MSSQLGALILLAAFNGGTRDATIYDSYKEAYRAAQSEKLPVLVILNPGSDSEETGIDLEFVRRAKLRRELLQKYVVAVIDTSTEDGQVVHKLFDSPPLPRVSVLDKSQKWQIYRTSKELSAEDWNLVLEKHQEGALPPPKAKPRDCFT